MATMVFYSYEWPLKIGQVRYARLSWPTSIWTVDTNNLVHTHVQCTLYNLHFTSNSDFRTIINLFRMDD